MAAAIEVPKVRDITPERVSAERKPSGRQVYAVAHLAVELLGLEWPADRRACSVLIGQLREAASSAVAADEVPF